MGHVWHLGAVYCLTIFPMSGEPPFLSTWWEQRNTLQKSSRPHHWLHDFLGAGARASGARPDGISSSSLGWSLEQRLSGSGDKLEGTKAPLRNDWFLVRGRKCTQWICKVFCFFFFHIKIKGAAQDWSLPKDSGANLKGLPLARVGTSEHQKEYNCKGLKTFLFCFISWIQDCINNKAHSFPLEDADFQMNYFENW